MLSNLRRSHVRDLPRSKRVFDLGLLEVVRIICPKGYQLLIFADGTIATTREGRPGAPALFSSASDDAIGVPS